MPLERHAIDVRDEPVSAFLGPQRHLATEHCCVIDPTDLDEYLARDGFRALQRALGALGPEQVIEQVRASGLRGRGGAGFPTGQKWARVRAAEGKPKYVVCNGDEGDPGAFMDRMLLESYPYRIIEGIIIAAWAVGAAEGYLYIRAEYPLAVQRVRDRLVLRGLAGAGKGQFNLHMARAEAMLSEGKYYDAAGEFEVAAVLAPENPLPMLGSALARFAADEPLTAAFQLRTAFWRFLALMETQVDLDGMLGKKVVDLRLRLIEQRIAQQKDNPQAPLVFLAAFVRHSRGEKDKAAAHARMLKRLAGNDRIYRTFAEYVLTGKVGTGGKTSPAGTKAR